jgi:hypothetical protein
VCRKDIRKQKVKKNKMIDNAVHQMISSLQESKESQEGLEKYKQRLESYREWKEKHLLCAPGKVVKPGEKVDVRDTEHIWCVGQIELKICTQNRQALLYIHYEGWNRKYDEYIFVNSDRLAPHGTYT